MIHFLATNWPMFALFCFLIGVVVGFVVTVLFQPDDDDKREACILEYWRGHSEGKALAYKSGGVLNFNPYTGTRRDPRDIESDPHGILMVESSSQLSAATPMHLRAGTNRDHRGRFVSKKPRKAKM